MYKYNPVEATKMAKELYECANISASLDIRMDKLRRSVLGQKEFEIKK